MTTFPKLFEVACEDVIFRNVLFIMQEVHIEAQTFKLNASCTYSSLTARDLYTVFGYLLTVLRFSVLLL